MKGTNELRLNKATVVEALQMWADANFIERSVVTDFDKADTYSDLWTVTVAKEEAPPIV